MFLKSVLAPLLRRPPMVGRVVVPARSWTQVGNVVSTPPRVQCSFAEKMVHGFIMMFIWLSPICFFLSQLKVWRRTYVED
ncbi:hypothetical protein JYU34_019547 [Plutella xylostella]|uniref:Cytochrome c oxidase polypeptide VIII n=1 Tax=Plutella xylostella TaxID=51655 RepID=A0ABQ7PXB3_PLUXY|nr:hypothetical protein JYU34_019547 [Plutella xylostella]